MKKKYFLLGCFLFGLLYIGTGYAEDAPVPPVDDIVSKSNIMSFYQGLDAKAHVQIVITDKQGRIRSRMFHMLRKDDDQSNLGQKFYSFFQAPADVRKMVFMVHKHADPKKPDDRWLYLPGLDLVERIASGDKRTSFVGSDFLYEDISGRNPADDHHELVRSTGSRYIVKNTPKNPADVEFSYYLAYIDTGNFIPVRIDFFKQDAIGTGRCYRTIEAIRIENIPTVENGREAIYPTIMESVAKNLETGSNTRLIRSHVSYNTDLDADLFTERYLRRPPKDALR